jgi:hypothetical protein
VARAKKAGEFYTPQAVSSLLAKIVTQGKTQLKSVYDPTCGSGSLILRVAKEVDVLRFMANACGPFTNNAAENSIRMTKVQQKLSGCFHSTDGAKIFCRVRGYLAACSKQGVSATLAMTLVFEGKLPEFAL